MRVIVTAGPSCEPIDQVRFLSNFSTGELGALLAQALHKEGFEVICFRSTLATYPIDTSIKRVIPFTTNNDLARSLEQLASEQPVLAFFHAAALCDYAVKEIWTLPRRGKREKPLSFGKIPTESGELVVTLQPTIKIIAKLRGWFPKSGIIGWKYEVEGTRREAIAKAEHQVNKYQLDASIANGPVFNKSFEFITASQGRNTCTSLDHSEGASGAAPFLHPLDSHQARNCTEKRVATDMKRGQEKMTLDSKSALIAFLVIWTKKYTITNQ